jgi:dolichol-phosphate mannosyltransferase
MPEKVVSSSGVRCTSRRPATAADSDRGGPARVIQSSQNPPIRGFCLALPAYNEEGAIGPLLDAAAAIFDAQRRPWSIVVVDDGSADRTAAIVEEHAAREPRIRLVRHERNRGLGPAIVTGLKAGLALAEGDPAAHLVIGMDADMTHPPETIPSMIDAADAGADVVIASRYQPGSRQVGVPPFRLLLSWGARRLFRYYLNLPGVRDYTCGFRAIRGSLLVAGFEKYGQDGLITRSGFACTDELLVHLAMLDPVIREVPFTLRYDRKVGASKMNIGLTVRETIKLLKVHRDELRGRGQGRIDSD